MIRILELFGGIGACSSAFSRLGIKYEIADYVEIDKYAVKSYNAIHGTNFQPQDITTWDKNIEVDLIMHGSPCQDFSLAGKQAGGDEGSGTRSSLMYETIRIVKKLKPKYVIWENVKNLISKKHRHNFDAYLETMSSLGYTNYYQVLNAKDYGIPQNRERVFTISILGNDTYEFPKENKQECEVINPLQGISGKSWQFEQNVYSENSILRSLKAGGGSGNIPKVIEHFEFPPKQELKLKLKDMLEDNVDEKYYLSDEQVNAIKYSNYNQNKRRIQEKEYADTLYARDWKDTKCIQVNRKYGIFDTEKSTHQAGSVYDENGLSPTLDTMQGGYRQPCIEVKNNTQKGYLEAYEGDGVYTNVSTKRGTVQKDMIQTLTTFQDKGVVVKEDKTFIEKHYDNFKNKNGYIPEMFNPYNESEIKEVAPTQSTQCGSTTSSATVLKHEGLRIRKLTPKECWRLMGFTDEEFNCAAKVNSNTQLYKQAGNSIVVDVLVKIFTNLFKNKKEK